MINIRLMTESKVRYFNKIFVRTLFLYLFIYIYQYIDSFINMINDMELGWIIRS